MIVAELIEELRLLDQNAEVRIAVQPIKPREFKIAEDIGESDGIVYILQGESKGFLSNEVADDLELIGWCE